MKKFDIPYYYRSSIIGRVKQARRLNDPRKQDLSPSILDFGPVRFYLARHFGFCYGVENAIEISYKALEENPNKRIFLLSQMIHNQEVNEDLEGRGIQFIMDTDGNPILGLDHLKANDVVIVPAFGTTLEIKEKLEAIGIELKKYDTTCPFVEKVWNRSEELGKDDFTVIIHGKYAHEETRATFSHSRQNAPSLIIRDLDEAKVLAEFIQGDRPNADFHKYFEGKFSPGFDPEKHLQKLGVVNQTTMLASETQAIAEFIKQTMINHYGEENFKEHYADTRDTLCYATNDNQDATYQLLEQNADLALVIGGYNSSNTSHIVELCESKFPTYFINSDGEIVSSSEIRHYDLHQQQLQVSHNFIPSKRPVDIILTSGASCPDIIVERVLVKLLDFFPEVTPMEEVLSSYATP
ncbi:MAG: 4-hydroxy-3-methylbut-2-enyl diphosphate reductase [Bacteroidetes bacterium]|nr:4-hydroxy-3-methylbut-2-enyl diphosphate reductase [Bacteroidota bacterium]